MAARDQFGDAERLDHVVVGAGLEQPDLLFLVGFDRENDNRDVGPGADQIEHFVAAAVG